MKPALIRNNLGDFEPATKLASTDPVLTGKAGVLELLVPALPGFELEELPPQAWRRIKKNIARSVLTVFKLNFMCN